MPSTCLNRRSHEVAHRTEQGNAHAKNESMPRRETIFQAGHAGSIPVTRSRVSPQVRDPTRATEPDHGRRRHRDPCTSGTAINRPTPYGAVARAYLLGRNLPIACARRVLIDQPARTELWPIRCINSRVDTPASAVI